MRFRDALRGPGLAAIAEFKRRSPSAGEINARAEPDAFARAYARSGAAAMSVLVDERFGGSWGDLRAARAAVRLPLLAKGFFSTRDDLRTAKEAGADAVLLLLRDLDDALAAELMEIASRLGLDALVEAHDAGELERAVRLGADPIGVNARDLSTFRIDRDAQLELVAAAPRERVVIAESGIDSRPQAAAAELAGADAILVGTSLMRARDPGAKLIDLISRPLVKVCGLTRQDDVDAAVAAGADLCGFILVDASPRRAPGVLAADGALTVAVFVGEPEETDADLVQLYPREPGRVRGRDGVVLRGGEPVAQVLDLPWDGADPRHLERAAAAPGRIMLAGKLGPENVAEAVRRVRPWAVDAASRLEREPGVKDHARVRAYVEAARG